MSDNVINFWTFILHLYEPGTNCKQCWTVEKYQELRVNQMMLVTAPYFNISIKSLQKHETKRGNWKCNSVV